MSQDTPKRFALPDRGFATQHVHTLRRALDRAQRRGGDRALYQSKRNLNHLAEVLLRFQLDRDDPRGLWATYERHNLDRFGVALPLTGHLESDPTRARVRHLLWTLYAVLNYEVPWIAPDTPHLTPLVDATVETLDALPLPSDGDPRLRPGLQAFDLDDALQLKTALLFFCTDAYLLKTLYQIEQLLQPDLHIDAFVRRPTLWCGLRPCQLLADFLDLSPTRRAQLQRWHQPHNGVFHILHRTPNHARLESFVGEAVYEVQVAPEDTLLRTASAVRASLVPWDDRWVLHDRQQLIQAPNGPTARRLLWNVGNRHPDELARVWPDMAPWIEARAAHEHAALCAHFGGREATFPDARAFLHAVTAEARARPDGPPHPLLPRCGDVVGPPRQISLSDQDHDEPTSFHLWLSEHHGPSIALNLDALTEALHTTTPNPPQRRALTHSVTDPGLSPDHLEHLLVDHRSSALPRLLGLASPLPNHDWDALLSRHKTDALTRTTPTILGHL